MSGSWTPTRRYDLASFGAGDMSRPPRILCLSNGHGEDQVACQVALQIQAQDVSMIALPIVGEGRAYRSVGIPILNVTQTMPSGGFVYADVRQLWRDIQGGLLALTGRQLQAIRHQRAQVDLVLAVGDIVVLLMAWWSGAPYCFVGTAKSDYYWRDEHGPYRRYRIPWLQPCSDYLPWERWLMRRPRCQGVYPRDSLTTKALQTLGIPAFDLGNPMMDGLEAANAPLPPDPEQPTLLLLPGSRPPEAYENWQRMMQVVQRLPQSLRVYAAISATLDAEQLMDAIPELHRIQLIQGQFGSCAHQADVVLATTGTATEQCVGLGKPVVSLPGDGPQFTPAFAEAQTRLLGSSVQVASVDTAATLIQHLIEQLDQDPIFKHTLIEHGRRRMGIPGAATRIAQHIVESMEAKPQ